MSCNPAIGGIGKGHLVREIDALGGAMAQAADRAGIQCRTLNASKGPAVRATRCQADRALYRARDPRACVETSPTCACSSRRSTTCCVDDGRVAGVRHPDRAGDPRARVVLTAGTFLRGRDPRRAGTTTAADARAIRPRSALAERLRGLPLGQGRLKTGTPPRIDGRSIDFAGLERAARRRAAAGVLVPRQRRRPSTPGVLLDHPHQRPHP